MNNSKSAWPFQLFFANIKKRIENFFKSCFPKNKIYVDASTQTDDSSCSLDQDFTDSSEILSPQQDPEANPSISKFRVDSQFRRIIKLYSQLNSSSYPPLNLNKGLSFEPIYAEGQSPAEIKLKSFNATLETYKNISPASIPHPIYQGLQWSSKVDSYAPHPIYQGLRWSSRVDSYPSHPIYTGLQWSSKVDSYPSSNSESLFLPIESEVKFLSTIDRASTSIEKPVLLISSTKVVTRRLFL
jgi:hypothetical protein